MNIKLITFFVFIISCHSQEDILLNETLPYTKLVYYNGLGKVYREATCDEKKTLVNLRKFYLDTIIEFNFIKNDTFSEFIGLDEKVYNKAIFSKNIIVNGKVIFKGKALEIDSVNACICRNICFY